MTDPRPSGSARPQPARADELGQDRLGGFGGLMQRVGAIEGVAVLLLVAVGLIVFGLASDQVWAIVVGAVLTFFTIADIVILAAVRKRLR